MCRALLDLRAAGRPSCDDCLPPSPPGRGDSKRGMGYIIQSAQVGKQSLGGLGSTLCQEQRSWIEILFSFTWCADTSGSLPYGH